MTFPKRSIDFMVVYECVGGIFPHSLKWTELEKIYKEECMKIPASLVNKLAAVIILEFLCLFASKQS